MIASTSAGKTLHVVPRRALHRAPRQAGVEREGSATTLQNVAPTTSTPLAVSSRTAAGINRRAKDLLHAAGEQRDARPARPPTAAPVRSGNALGRG